MSDVNFLDKLLDGVGVEWRPLAAVLVRTKGTKITAGEMRGLHKDGAPVKIFAGGKTVAFVDFEDIPEKDVNREPSIIVKSRGIIEFDYYEKPFSHKNEMWSYHASGKPVDIKYVYHFLKLNERHFQSIGSKMQMPQIATPDTDKFEIPIPCPNNPKKSLEIQAEIVRILDAMTELTTELNNELTVRKKQYKHYRDQLLSFEDGEVEWKTLDEISQKISSGGTPSTSVSEYYDGDIPWLRTQEVDFREIWDTEIKITEAGVKNSSAKWIPANCVIVAMYGATVGKIGINKIPMTTNQACANINLDETVANYRFVFHFLTSQYEYIKSLGAGSQTNINAQIVKNLQVPIPFAKNPKKSLDEQARIVAILDKFDALTNSLTEGLPREIELRQKQYEYYRDLLLSFPKPQEVVV